MYPLKDKYTVIAAAPGLLTVAVSVVFGAIVLRTGIGLMVSALVSTSLEKVGWLVIRFVVVSS